MTSRKKYWKYCFSIWLYMAVNFQKVSPADDFWDSLSPHAQERIQRGLADAEAGRYSSAQSFLDQLKAS